MINIQNRKLVAVHILFWCSYTLLNHFINIVQSYRVHVYLIDSIVKYSVAAFTFYGTLLFILPRFFRPGKYWILCGCVLAMYFIAHFIKVFLYYKVLVIFGFPKSPYTFTEFFFLNIWWWSQYTLFAFGYWFALEAIKKQKELHLKEQKMLSLENERLRAQISPHFLFNTLNYFYNKVSPLQPEVAEGITSLAGIMRASIRKPDKDGLVFLEEEIMNIEQLINIYRLRYNNTVHISFTQDGRCGGLRILPHILTTLAENGFKHGELRTAAYPLTISVSVENRRLRFLVSNKKRTGPKELSHGIGMDYIRTHLNSVYKGLFTLFINEDLNFYKVTLNITLLNERMEHLHPATVP